MNLADIRDEIDDINEKMIVLFQKRMELSKNVIAYKTENNIPILNKKREEEIISRFTSGDPFAKQFFESILEISRNWQTHLMLKKNIVLIGMMGSGKTTIGSLLSNKLVLPFIDIDSEIEKTAKMSIPSIFSSIGEEPFRELETKEIIKATKKTPCIISTGGGVVLKEENMKALKENGMVFFLNRPTKSIEADINLKNRPLLKNNTNKVSEIFNERLPLYRQYADYELKSAKPPEDIMAQIINLLQTEITD